MSESEVDVVSVGTAMAVASFEAERADLAIEQLTTILTELSYLYAKTKGLLDRLQEQIDG
jgi:hypothetical protein